MTETAADCNNTTAKTKAQLIWNLETLQRQITLFKNPLKVSIFRTLRVGAKRVWFWFKNQAAIFLAKWKFHWDNFVVFKHCANPEDLLFQLLWLIRIGILHYLHLFYELTPLEPWLLQIRGGEHEAIINSLSLSSIPLDIIKLPR